MAAESRSNTAKTITEVLDGFTALSEEYKALARQHVALRRQLSLVGEQCDALRKLVPKDQQPDIVSSTIANDTAAVSHGSRNLSDWIDDMRESATTKDGEAIASVRTAEFAAFKLRERIDNSESHAAKVQRKMQSTCALPDSRKSSLSHRNSGAICKQKSISFVDMEDDYTVARQPGELACPFARKPKQSSALVRDTVSRHNLPTPRSSGSHSHRPSFNDPLRPTISNESEVAEEDSEREETGPACPIRFLDQHSPEELASYFEEHKHELPTSHADCVKRFQTSADSLKELDAKYGSLVTMIQGLGHKHQPMLPEEVIAQDEDTKSARKIKKWVKAVSEEPQGQSDEPEIAVKEPRALSEVAGEERISHFDRPLKEVRVGESPSRPWGVPIPSKYLDQAVAGVCSDVSETPAEASIPPQVQSQPAAVAKAIAPRGKCPFGHSAGPKPLPKDGPNSQPEPLPALTRGQAQVDDILQDSPLGHDQKKQPDTATTDDPRPLVINHGLAVVSSAASLNNMTMDNRGTLIFGYDKETSLSMQSQYYRLGR